MPEPWTDWACPHCGLANRPRADVCFICREPRPGGATPARNRAAPEPGGLDRWYAGVARLREKYGEFADPTPLGGRSTLATASAGEIDRLLAELEADLAQAARDEAEAPEHGEVDRR